MLVFMLLIAGIAASPDAQLSVALAVAQEDPELASLRAKLKVILMRIEELKASRPLDYYAAYDRALRQGKTMIVFVGVRPRQIGHAIVGEQGDYQQPGPLLPPDYPPVCIVIAIPSPDGTAMHWHATLPHTATDADIQRAMRPAPRPPVQVAPVRWQGAAFSGGRSPVC